MRTCRLR